MIVRNLRVFTATVLITWSAVFFGCHCQIETTVDGPTNTAYVSPGGSESFNCSVTWAADATDLDSMYWKRSRDGVVWTQIAQCYKQGICTIVGEFQSMYSYETNSPDFNFFKLIISPATLDEDGMYDCHHYDVSNPSAPHATLVVLDQVDDVIIEGFNHDDTDIVNAGEDTTYKCLSTSGNPPADLQWTIGTTDITSYSVNSTSANDDDDRLYDTESSLTYNFNASNNGETLRCRGFQHQDLTIRSSRIVMTVYHAPVIHTIEIVEWGTDYQVEVRCDATGNPDVDSYTWTNNENDATGYGETWTVEDVTQDNTIDVTCEATNSIGTSSLTMELSKPSSAGPTVSPSSIIILIMVFCGVITISSMH